MMIKNTANLATFIWFDFPGRDTAVQFSPWIEFKSTAWKPWMYMYTFTNSLASSSVINSKLCTPICLSIKTCHRPRCRWAVQWVVSLTSKFNNFNYCHCVFSAGSFLCKIMSFHFSVLVVSSLASGSPGYFPIYIPSFNPFSIRLLFTSPRDFSSFKLGTENLFVYKQHSIRQLLHCTSTCTGQMT